MVCMAEGGEEKGGETSSKFVLSQSVDSSSKKKVEEKKRDRGAMRFSVEQTQQLQERFQCSE